MRTRTKPTKTAAAQQPAETAPKPLPLPDDNPPKLFILPKSLSKNAKIVTLAHPRTLAPTRYYHCPETGIYEIKRIEAPPSSCRSLLLAPEQDESKEQDIEVDAEEGSEAQSASSQGYVCQNAAFFTVTAIDPLFLVLPVLSPKPKPASAKIEGKALFLSADDLFENFFEHSKHMRNLTRHENTRHLLESRLAAVCDAVDAGDEKMYRLNYDNLLKELMSKAEAMSESGLPPSMEENFVKRALEVPMVSLLVEEEENRLKREESISELALLDTSAGESANSQSTASTAASADSQSFSTTSTQLTTPTPLESQTSTSASALQPTEEIKHLLRLRTSLSFLFSSYVPPHLEAILEALLDLPKRSSIIDFAPLNKHLDALAALRAEATVRSSLYTTQDSRKRAFEHDQEAVDKAAKKHKAEEEERKRKVNESRGVRDLKKVDTKGMKKMSDFFKKK